MYNSSSYPQWRDYVEKQCPDIHIVWENNRNTTANVLYQARHGDMPDIVAIRRFESDTAMQLQPWLQDLGDLAVTRTYEPKYLSLFAVNGRQYWLPEPGAFDGMVANKNLFDQWNLALPTDYKSFIAVCRQLEEHGVTPLAVDFAESWTPTTMMQGITAPWFYDDAKYLTWMEKFRAGKVTELNAQWLLSIANTARDLNREGILTADMLQDEAPDTQAMLLSGKAAIVRKNSDEVFDSTNSHNYAALPFFGTTASDSQLFTYPVFSLAVSKELQQDAALQQAAERVLSVMLSEQAQKILNENGEGLISYNKDINLPLSDAMKNVQSLIRSDACTIRVLNANTFSSSGAGLTALLRDHADNHEFSDIMNRTMFVQTRETTVGKSDLYADNALDSNLCSRAASVVAQVVNAREKTDCFLMDVRECPTSIYRGTYTDKDIGAVVNASAIYTGRLTMAQLQQLLGDSILYATTFRSGSIEPVMEYPAIAGTVVTVKTDGSIVSIGQLPGKLLTVGISEGVYHALAVMDSPLLKAFTAKDTTLVQSFSDGFRETGSLPAPQEYFRVNR